jgi:hypothetical protein
MANPSPDTSGLKPFQPGQSGNPGGKSAETIRLEREAADIALRMRLKWLKALEAQAEAGDEAALGLLSSEALNLAKQSEDRAHGTPRQSVEHSGQGENGEIIFKTVYHTKDG